MHRSANSLQRAVLLAAVATVAAGAAAQPAGVPVETRWVFEADAAHPGTTVRAALQVRIRDRSFHVHSNKPRDEFLIPTTLTLTPPAGFAIRQVVYPPEQVITASFSEEPLSVFEQDFVIGVALDVGDDVVPGEHPLPAELGYQACNDRVCLMPVTRDVAAVLRIVAPETPITPTGSPLLEEIEFSDGDAGPEPSGNGPGTAVKPPVNGAPPPPSEDCDVMAELEGFTVMGTAGGYLGRDEFIEFIEQAETGTVNRSPLEGKGPLVILLLVLLGGIALNLTPCVLPLIPINLAIIGAGAQAGSRARGFALGGTYGLAMAAVYGGLGLIVILTASTFGTINSTIWFNVGIAILFVLLGLAMFDVISIDFTRFQGKLNVAGHAKRGTFALAFGMGAVAALLAGACVAPVVIQVIVYSGDQYAKGVRIALALPFFLGLGMALPWPFAGAGLSLLPKPGKWMVRVKQGMGVFILLFAVYYGYVAWEIYSARRANEAGGAGGVATAHLEEGWTASICDGLARARAENRPVFIDMWATWCKNCLTMDKTTFKNEDVRARLDGYVKIKLQAEDLEASPAREILRHFEGIGLPTYAVLRVGEGDSGE